MVPGLVNAGTPSVGTPSGRFPGAATRDVAQLLARAAAYADEHGETMSSRARRRLGDRLAQRLEHGLELLVEAARDPGALLEQIELGTADPQLEWAACVVAGTTDPDDVAFRHLLERQQASRIRRRQLAPLPTERWRRMQRDGRLSHEQTESVQRLVQRARSFDSVVGDAYRRLLDDCYQLAAAQPVAGTVDRVEALVRLDEEVVVLDDRLRRVVEAEWLRSTSTSPDARSPRVLVIVGPPSVGKRRFAVAAAAALGSAHHHVRCASLGDPRTAVLGEWSPPDEVVPGALVDAALDAGGASSVLHLEGIDELAPQSATMLAATIVDLVDDPERALSARYLPEGFAIRASDFLIVVSARDRTKVPAILLDNAEVIELGPPTAAQRVRIATEFILADLCRRHDVGDSSAVVSGDVVATLVDRHDARAGMRELERDLARVFAAWVARGRGESVDLDELERLVGAATADRGPAAIGSVWVPLLDESSGIAARLDVTVIPGYTGTLVPEMVHPRTAARIGDAIECVRKLAPLGLSIPAGLRVNLNMQSADRSWHAPWLSTAAALAACSLAAGQVLHHRRGVLAVLTPWGELEPVDLPGPLASTLVRAMDWTEAVVPGHELADVAVAVTPAVLADLLRWCGLVPVANRVPGMYL